MDDTSSTPLVDRSKQKMEKEKLTFAKGDSVVTFIIGPGPDYKGKVDPKGKEERFIVHKEFVCYYSSVLDAAFNGPFIEGQTQTYQMDDVSPGAFRKFIHWLYSQDIHVKQLDGVSPVGHFFQQQAEDMYLAELWVLAEKLLIPHLQNAVIETIFDFQHAAVATFNYIYERTNDRTSPLRRLAFHHCKKFVHEQYLIKIKDSLPKEFLLEMTCALKEDLREASLTWASGGTAWEFFNRETEPVKFFVDIDREVKDGQWVENIKDSW